MINFLKASTWLILVLISWVLCAQTTAQLDSIWKEIELEGVVVTAQYAPTHSKNAVHQVKVIKASEIEQQGFNNLAEVLTNQLNLRVSTNPILGNGLKIQGIGGENVQVMIDGVPIIGRVDGDIDLSQINLNNIDRIEIIEGAMSAQYGSNASGGVINIISKKSQIQPFQLKSQNQYESIGIWNNSLSAGLQWKKLYANLHFNRNESQFASDDSLRLYETIILSSGESRRTKVTPWNPKTQQSFDATARYRFSDSLNLTYQYRNFDEELRILGEVRRPTFRPYAFDETYTTKREDHSLHIEAYLGSKIYLNSTTAYNQYDRLKATQRLDFEPDTTSLVLGGQDSTYFDSFLHRSVLSTLSERKINGQLGLEMLYESGTGERIIDSTSAPFNKAQLANYAAWAGLKFEASTDFTLLANLRYGYNTKYHHPLISSLHANWKAHKNWNMKISFAQGFRAPSLKELHFNFIDVNHYIVGNTNLKAEKSKNASFSLEYKPKNSQKHQFSAQTKFFYNTIKNRIVLAEYSATEYNYQNLEKFDTHGFNLQLQYEWKKQLSLKTGLAYTRLYNTLSEDFNTNKFTPLTELQNELSYQIPFLKTHFLLTHRFIGRQVRFIEDSEGILQQGFIGDYHLINLTLNRHFWKKRILLALGVKNLSNTQTVPLTGGDSGEAHSSSGESQLLNWGRTYFVKLNVRLF